MSDHELSPCSSGRQMRDKHFLLAPSYTSLNHGAYGTYPKSVQKRFHEVQALSEARPDYFMNHQYPVMWNESRAAMADFLGVPIEEVVFVANASTATNTVLRSLRFETGDVILYFSTAYGAVQNTIEYLRETTAVDGIKISVEYPIDDAVLISRFQQAIQEAKSKGLRVRIANFDTVTSTPGVRVPWERLVEVCKVEGVLSLVDGAHSVGQIVINLSKAQPDFFASNCHKWLYVPRSCAVFYVPERNQHLIRSSLPTSDGFDPLSRTDGEKTLPSDMVAPDGKSKFERLFELVATRDQSSFLCILEALKFRREVCGGEEMIMQHCEELSNRAGILCAEVLGTKIMQNEDETLTRCFMTNIELPMKVGPEEGEILEENTYKVIAWMSATMVQEYDLYSPVYIHVGKFWTRWSGQTYLEMDDYAKGAEVLKAMCERVKKGEYLQDVRTS